VLWYFLLSRRTAVAATAPGAGPQEVTITVLGGYDPTEIEVAAGRPVRLHFDRREDASCSEEIVIPEFGIRTYLPAHRQTTVEFTPQRPGRYDMSCGMGMLHGKLIVR
jgi:plastocyanin domain-containing protein